MIGDLEIALDMSDILYNGVSFADDDENYLDYLGIIFKDIEKAIDDKDNLEVIVPDERPEVTISISSDVTIEPDVEPDDTEPKPINETKPVEPEPTTPEPIPIEPESKPRDIQEPTEPVEPEVPDEPEPKSNTGIIVISAVTLFIGIMITLYKIKKKQGGGKAKELWWLPGMAGILEKKYLKQYKEAIGNGDKEKADKLKKTLFKYISTISEKYLTDLLEKQEKEPEKKKG